jgi:hypothetical protein
MSYVNTVHSAAWHIPCYASHNCQTSQDVQEYTDDNQEMSLPTLHQSAGMPISIQPEDFKSSPDGALSQIFIAVMAFISVVLVVVACATLNIKRGHKSTYSLFLFSILATDFLMGFIVMPLNAVHSVTSNATTAISCMTWLLVQIVTISARSWTMPAMVLLLHLHDGFVPIRRLVIVLTWVWIASGLLALPPLVTASGFLDTKTCHVIDAQGNMMLVYIVVMTFFLPSCILSPLFIKWANLDATFKRISDSYKIEDDQHVSIIPGKKTTTCILPDMALPKTVRFFSVAQVFCWGPFFLVLIVAPNLASFQLPMALTLFTILLGYSQSLVTPVFVLVSVTTISQRIFRRQSRNRRDHPETDASHA